MAAQQFQQQQQQKEAVVVDDKTTSSASCMMSDPKLFPPGFRFHPTDEELILYWLKRKMCRQSLRLDMIAETDVYKWDPQDLPDLSKLRTGDRQWFFFSPRDRKYPNGARSNRATMHGYWKATGKDRSISCNSRSVGVKKTLVYYIGRAPSGERTDWVMHEYTLDEEELKRCPAQEYYALYKVYKKSGPGPKNGEQYGAPFREEDWADDDCVNFNGMLNQGNPIKESEVARADDTRANTQAQVPLDDLVEEFLNQIANEPTRVPPIDVDYTYALDNLLGDEENGSALASHQSREVNLLHQSMLLHHSQQCNMQPSFGFTQSTTTQLQLHGACDITSVLNICEQNLGENFLEDFLEIDDLGAELNAQNFETPTEELTLDQIDQLPGFYNDATMVFHDVSQGEVGSSSQPCTKNHLGGGIPNMVSASYGNNCVNEAVKYPVQSYLNDADQMGLQRWTQQDQRVAAIPLADVNQAAVCQQSSGVLSNYGNPANPPTEATHGQSVAVDGGDSWLTSALWAFVESIPTTPASASETALVNKAFERVTSFGKLNINSGKKDDSATASRRSRSSKLGILAFSILGIFCAILWVLIGSSMKLLWGCSSS